MRIDIAEIGRERLAGELDDGAGELDTSRAATDDDEIEKPPSLVRVGARLRALEGDEDLAPDVGRVLDLLQAGRDRLPFVMPEIGVPCARRDDQHVVADAPLAELDQARAGIDIGDAPEQHLGIALLAEYGADRHGDLGRR